MQAPEFWWRDGVVPRLLAPAAAVWRAGTVVRRRCAAPVHAGAPTICVGNAVAGGAGKTPVALAIARALAARGAAPHFLTRGYGGSERGPLRVDPSAHDAGRVGDEALLLAAAAPVWVARNRAAGALAAAANGAGIVVMDDGLQNFGVAKDYALLVIDGGFGFGNGRLMPAGPLREPLRNVMQRVDAIVIVGEDRCNLRKDLQPPVLAARFVPLPGSESIAGRPVVAFAGIGRPEKFFETLAGMDCDLVSVRRFPDHHAYTADEVMRCVEAAAAANAVAVTTEKDAVRIPPEARNMVEVLQVGLEWQNPAAFDRIVERMPGEPAPRRPVPTERSSGRIRSPRPPAPRSGTAREQGGPPSTACSADTGRPGTSRESSRAGSP